MKKSLIRPVLAALILSMLLFLPAQAHLAWGASRSERHELYFYALDVGEGDSSLFIFPNGQTMLIDAGPEDAGRNVVKYLKSLHVKKIDCLVATHPHSDHIGGMIDVMGKFEIGKVWDSGFVLGSKPQKDFYLEIKRQKIRFGRPKRGYAEKFGDVSVEVLAPAKEIRNSPSDANNNSIVLLIKYGSVSFLMAGDMEIQERGTIWPPPGCTVLKAAHHGSRNGTDKKFLEATSPKIVILSYGKGNRYGHPHKETTDAVAEMGIKRFDTAEGTLRFKTDGTRITYRKDREVIRHEKQK